VRARGSADAESEDGRGSEAAGEDGDAKMEEDGAEEKAEAAGGADEPVKEETDAKMEET
jgi:hypothetical protein